MGFCHTEWRRKRFFILIRGHLNLFSYIIQQTSKQRNCGSHYDKFKMVIELKLFRRRYTCLFVTKSSYSIMLLASNIRSFLYKYQNLHLQAHIVRLVH